MRALMALSCVLVTNLKWLSVVYVLASFTACWNLFYWVCKVPPWLAVIALSLLPHLYKTWFAAIPFTHAADY